MSSISFYFGHHISSIEGGMIYTNDKDIYDLLKMLRSHGWDRDLDEDKQNDLIKENDIDNFNKYFTFYVPAFNVRSTDLQAFIGIKQMDKIEEHNKIRYNNFIRYQNEIKNYYWKVSD
jgi:CDP-6-deoxy-D-xylo-4-hexulose-3-dehydrase